MKGAKMFYTMLLSQPSLIGGGPSYDADALAFISAVETTTTLSTTIKDAIDRLVRDLKGEYNASYTTYNVYSKFKALYPVVGGLAATHSLNLINPATFPLSFYGSPTHSPNGIDFNGINQYADTGVAMDVEFSATNKGVTLFAQSIASLPYATLFGVFQLPLNIFGIRTYTGNIELFGYNNGYSDAISLAGRKVISLDSGIAGKMYFDGGLVHTGTAGATSPPGNMFIAALNFGGASNYAQMRMGLFSMHESLTGGELAFLNNTVSAFQTALSRY